MPRTQKPATIVRQLKRLLARMEKNDFGARAEDSAVRAAIEIIAAVEPTTQFVAGVALMKAEEEIEYGGASEDHIATLNDLIGGARKITGRDPHYPKVYCIECGTGMEGCICEGEDEGKRMGTSESPGRSTPLESRSRFL